MNETQGKKAATTPGLTTADRDQSEHPPTRAYQDSEDGVPASKKCSLIPVFRAVFTGRGHRLSSEVKTSSPPTATHGAR